MTKPPDLLEALRQFALDIDAATKRADARYQARMKEIRRMG